MSSEEILPQKQGLNLPHLPKTLRGRGVLSYSSRLTGVTWAVILLEPEHTKNWNREESEECRRRAGPPVPLNFFFGNPDKGVWGLDKEHWILHWRSLAFRSDKKGNNDMNPTCWVHIIAVCCVSYSHCFCCLFNTLLYVFLCHVYFIALLHLGQGTADEN